jgi:hypothetical protein
MRVSRVLSGLVAGGLALFATVLAGPDVRAATTGGGAAGRSPVRAVDGRAVDAVAHKRTAALPRPDHVVVVVEENRADGEVIGKAPYMTQLATNGADFTQSYAITHPSEPNYLALFSGSTQGVRDDSCPHTFTTGDLGAQLITVGDTFTGYSESLPFDGYTGCAKRAYARKHSPWVNFSNLPATTNLRYTRFPTDYTQLPTVSFVIPNLNHDAHDGTVAQADTWLKTNLDGYVQWAATHNSLLIVTFDEDDSSGGNRIATIFAGPMVTTGAYAQHITHYSVLRTLEDMYGLPCLGGACSATPIVDVWH